MLLTGGRAEIYFVKPSGATVIHLQNQQDPMALARYASNALDTPWAILVDQSEESFWGGVMPALRGAARTAWIERLANQSGTQSPYRWSDVQGKSRSQEGQLRILGYTLGRPEALTPWLDALKNCGARIRGVYSPVMLASQVLKLLNIKPPAGEDAISVLVTPYESGLRQTVLVGGWVRFSRLALNPAVEGEQWYSSVYQETGKLREYLVGNGLLKNEKVGMHIYSVLPGSAHGVQAFTTRDTHQLDHYQWIKEALPNLQYVAALAKRQAWRQLAPPIYRKRDLSVQGSRTLYAATAAILIAGLTYMLVAGSALWQKQTDIQAATEQTKSANLRYQSIAKTFQNSPLTSVQLLEMAKRWQAIQTEQPPDMRALLVAAGQTIERHPGILVDEMQWVADVNQANSGLDADPAPEPTTPPPSATGAQVSKKEVTALVLRGSVRGVASDDLRGTRDLLDKLEADFKRQPTVRLEITKRPLDLSAKSALTGSGTQDRAELSFEVKLWQR